MKNLFFLSLLSIFFGSCVTVKEPQYLGVENFQVYKLSPYAEYKMDVRFFNPNPMRARFKELYMSVKVFGNEMMVQTLDLDKGRQKIKPNSEFVVSLHGTSSYDKMGDILGKGLISLLGQKTEVPVEAEGYVIIKKFVFSKKVPLKFSEKVDLRKIKMPGQ